MTAVTFCMTNTHTRVGMARARVVSRGLISRGSVAVVHLVRQSQSVAGHHTNAGNHPDWGQDGWSLFLLVIMSRPVSVTTCHVHVSQEVEMTEGAGHHEREIRRDRGEVRSG